MISITSPELWSTGSSGGGSQEERKDWEEAPYGAMCSEKTNAPLECLSKYFFLWILLRMTGALYE